MRSEMVLMRYMKPSHWDTAMPSCFLTAWPSNVVLWGTLTALAAPLRATVRVLLQTTRMEVRVAVVAKVPSQLVAKRM